MNHVVSRWGKDETDEFIRTYPHISNKDIAIKLNRTVNSVQRKANELGLKKTQEVLYSIRSESRQREKGSNWKGGKKANKDGYLLVLDKNHPNCGKSGYIMEHRLVMEKYLGRLLLENEIVHHKNGVKNDNRIENLEVMERGKHTIKHHIGTIRDEKSRKLISIKTKERFRDKRNHPFYKEIDIKEMIAIKNKGKTVNEVCKHFGISNATYYNKLKEFKEV